MAEANGIDYISSTSSQGLSTIEAQMRLNYDPNAAIAEIQAKVASKRGELPGEVEDYLLKHGRRDMASLLRSVERLRDAAFVGKRRITVPLARVVLRVAEGPEKPGSE